MRSLALFLRMAVRNMATYKRRSLQTAVTVFLGIFFVALADAFMVGFAAGITRDFITEGGHVVAAAPGYAERREMMPLDRLIAGADRAAEVLRAVRKDIRVFASLGAAGLVTRGARPADPVTEQTESSVVLCVGVAPEPSGSPNPATDQVRKRMESGRFLTGTEPGMVLARKTAQEIGAGVGDMVVFLCSDKYSGFSAIELPLVGVVDSDSSFAGVTCYVDLESMRTVLGAPGEAAQLAVESWTPACAPPAMRRSQ